MRWLVAFYLLVLVPGTAMANCDVGEQVIRLGTVNDVDFAARNRAADLLRDAINREMQGKACMEIKADGAWLKSGLSPDDLAKAGVELVAPDYLSLGQISSEYRVFDLPFAFRNFSAVERFEAAAGKDLAVALEARGLVSLAFWHERFRQMSAKIPLVNPSDAGGLKFRSDTSSTSTEQIRALRAVSKPVQENDLLNALKTGVIDAQMTNWQQLEVDKTLTVQAGVTETNHVFEGYQLVASKPWWDKLDPQLAKTVSEIVARISTQTNFDTVRRDTNSRRAVMRSGAVVRTLTANQRQKWRAVMQPIWDDFRNARLLEALKKADAAF